MPKGAYTPYIMREKKMTEKQTYREVEEIEETPQLSKGISCAGPNGELDAGSMLWRKARTIGFKERSGWRVIVPCDRCANCIELRKFTVDGRVETSGWYCISGEIDTNPFATCNCGKKRRNGRKKVLYDLTNAPIGFENGLSDVVVSSSGMESSEVRSSQEPTVYVGGSVAPKGDGEKIPRRLMN